MEEERRPFTADDFTEDELVVLKMIFKIADEFAYDELYRRYCYLDSNAIANIKEKLGIDELLRGRW